MFIFGGILSILIPAFVHWGALPGELDSPWLFYAFFAGVGFSFVASLGFSINAKRQKKAKLEVAILGGLAFLIGSFWVHLLTLLI